MDDLPANFRWSIVVRGVVQGVGFRPFVHQEARRRKLGGWVRNESGQVRIEAQGPRDALEGFCAALRRACPSPARVDSLEIEPIPLAADAGEFRIESSAGASAPLPSLPADLAVCDACLAEIRDPAQRRHEYPFTNCTRCGPRWSIIERLPYDRPRTAMASFAMCEACRAEYENPADRRFHAQPIACPRCGPTLRLVDRNGREITAGSEALEQTARAILDGQIAALKGLGGFQLLVDATNNAAVSLLRNRKRRPDRPLALMFPSLDQVRCCCRVSEEESRALTSPQSPIVLLRRIEEQPCETASGSLSTLHSPLSTLLAPGNPYLGVMLPYTPLHHLLMDAVRRPVVCTSGNLSEEPMAIDDADALERLGPVADVFLTHDRPIVRPVDDSIVRVGPDGVQILRRARGYAPLPIAMQIDGADGPVVLAVGGHLKNTVALVLGGHAVISAHIGDLDSVASVNVFSKAIDDLLEFFEARPEAIVCDLHPDYASTQHARRLAERFGAKLLRVQHHHAHAAACMAEHALRGPVLGVSWDGTGYGADGTIWGGEFLLCEGAAYRRAAHLRTFALPGGDHAARQPRRSALGVLFELLGEASKEYALRWFSDAQRNTLFTTLKRGINAPRTSSMGRLFDAVAALCGLPATISFEGQAAMALEFAADPRESGAYEMPLVQSQADWAPMLRAILADLADGVSVGRISARFHNALANLAASAALAIAPAKNLPVVLGGGCFQNDLLTRRVRDRLMAEGFSVYTACCVPPGDGGLALGQAWLALQSSREPS